jgi:2-keto-3-deoxy-L-rhamnonate aldolase RhmA
MTTLYWVDENHDVHIETEDGESELPPAEIARLDGLDAVHGGPSDNRGPYVPVTPEHSKELRERAESNDDSAS